MRTPFKESNWYKARLVQNRKIGDLEPEIAKHLKFDYNEIKDQAQSIVAVAIKRGWVKHSSNESHPAN